MLAELFSTVLSLSIRGCILILFVFLIRPLLNKASHRYSYYLWIIVLLRLFIPFSFSAAHSPIEEVSKENIRESAYQYHLDERPEEVKEPAESFWEDVPLVSEVTPAVTEEVAAVQDNITVSKRLTPYQILSGIWLGGAALMAAASAVQYVRLRRKLAEAIHQEDNVYLSDAISTPFIVGVIRPKIYLPVFIEEKEEWYILSHERYHLLRKDPLIAFVSYIALCVYWFHPLVWLMNKYMRTDMEMSCDEAVTERFSLEVKKEYSLSMLKFSAVRNTPLQYTLAFTEENTKERVKHVMKHKRVSQTLAVCMILVLAVLTVTFFTKKSNAKEHTEESPQGYVMEIEGYHQLADIAAYKEETYWLRADLRYIPEHFQNSTDRVLLVSDTQDQSQVVYLRDKTVLLTLKETDDLSLLSDKDWEDSAEEVVINNRTVRVYEAQDGLYSTAVWQNNARCYEVLQAEDGLTQEDIAWFIYVMYSEINEYASEGYDPYDIHIDEDPRATLLSLEDDWRSYLITHSLRYIVPADASNEALVFDFNDNSIYKVVVSADGKEIVSAGDAIFYFKAKTIATDRQSYTFDVDYDYWEGAEESEKENYRQYVRIRDEVLQYADSLLAEIRYNREHAEELQKELRRNPGLAVRYITAIRESLGDGRVYVSEDPLVYPLTPGDFWESSVNRLRILAESEAPKNARLMYYYIGSLKKTEMDDKYSGFMCIYYFNIPSDGQSSHYYVAFSNVKNIYGEGTTADSIETGYTNHALREDAEKLYPKYSFDYRRDGDGPIRTGKVQILVDGLRIRSGSSLSSPIIGTAENGSVYDVWGVSENDGYLWYQIDYGYAYIAAKEGEWTLYTSLEE